jgi:hypothetical protein
MMKCPKCGCTEIWDEDCPDCHGAMENDDGEECETCEGSGYSGDTSECSECGHIDTAYEFEDDK